MTVARDLPARVRQIAEQVLAEQHYVRPIDVLLGLRWLAPSHVQHWEQGRIDHLADVTASSEQNHATAMAELRAWARERGLQPSEHPYVARTRDRRPLRFSASGDPDTELAFRTQWSSPDLPERVVEQAHRPPDLVVVAAVNPWTCPSCATAFEAGQMLMMEDAGPTCLECADLGHLEFLPSGHTALTRRAKRGSRLSAVVVRWSRSRRRYERQGILADSAAIEQAEADCLADQEVRERRRAREADRRRDVDERFVAELAAAVRVLFPGCPADRADRIARHAGARSSGRIGRTRAGREFDPDAVRLAVVASVRHEDTAYEDLLAAAVPRSDARDRVRGDVDRVLAGWGHDHGDRPPL